MIELDAIKAYWDYQKPDRPAGHIGMSAIGHCARQLAYHKHETKGIELDWRAKIIFDDGNLHHTQIRKALSDGLLLLNSCYALIREEEEVRLGILTGHIDGVLMHDRSCHESTHKSMLLEVKSMNDRGFQELKRTGVLGKEYAAQTSAYLRATGFHTACVLVKNKNTGEMLRLYYDTDDVLLDERLGVLFQVYKSDVPEEVEKEYGPEEENGKLPWQCNCCPFVAQCWSDSGLVKEGEKRYKVTLPIVVAVEELDKKTKKFRKRSE